MRSTKTIKMAQMAILIAVVLIMAFTPLGYLKTVGLEISLITIPVAIGAMVIGPLAGAVLGAVFGLTSFYQCFGMSQFGAMLLSTPTKSSPSMPIADTPGQIIANSVPTTTPARIRSIRLVLTHFSISFIVSGFNNLTNHH